MQLAIQEPYMLTIQPDDFFISPRRLDENFGTMICFHRRYDLGDEHMMDEDHFLHLTDVGREVAEKIYERHCFFTEQLITAGVDPKTAEADACRIEHIISDERFDRLKEAAEQEQD